MKKLVVFAMIMVVACIAVSCSEYGSEYEELAPPQIKKDTVIVRDTVTNTVTDTVTVVKTDTVKVEVKDTTTVTPPPSDGDDQIVGWASLLDRTFKVTDSKGVHNPAESRILVQDQNGKEYMLDMDFDFMIEVPESLYLKEKPATSFRNAASPLYDVPENYNQRGTVYDHWVSYTQDFNTNNFTHKFVLKYKQGYTLVRGAQVWFKPENHPTVSKYSFQTRNEEITVDKKVYNREISDLVVKITIDRFTLYRTATAVIDSYLRDVEEQKEEEQKEEQPETPETPTTVTADFYFNGLKAFISCTKVWRDDTKSWSDAYLFECENSYEIVLDNYKVNDKKELFVSREHKSVSKTTCPYSSKYNGVLCNQGQFYPGLITLNRSNKGWVVTSQPNGGVLTQSHGYNDADISGIKNFRKDNTAEPTPFIPNTPEVKEINGKKLITVVSQTSTHSGKVVVADKSLK